MKTFLQRVLAWLKENDSTLPRPSLSPPHYYRKVILREKRIDNEVVMLECGHRFRIIHHPRELWDCPHCAAEEKRKA